MQDIKVIGVGGIGTALLNFLPRYIIYNEKKYSLTLVDGDTIEEDNLARQDFAYMNTNKAQAKAQEIIFKFDNIEVDVIPEYITKDNIKTVVKDGDIVLMGVDNHKTRKIVSDYCSKLKNVTLISGGNDLYDGNVQVYIRRDGKDKTSNLTKYHPEIAKPKDKNPADLGCAEKAKLPKFKQLLFVNMGIAWLMLVTFFLIEEGREEKLGEIYLDILQKESLVANQERI